MLFDEILEGIKTVLEADTDTKDVIKLYRKYDIVEKGVHTTPLCVIGPRLDATNLANYIGNFYHFDLVVGVQLLDRTYNIPARHQNIIDVLDKLQADTCDAITSDHTLSGTVLDSHIGGLTYIRPTEEYVGFQVDVQIKTNVD